ncbi:MAG: hypothetical protein CM15mP111_1500 [Hyphomicrobiales bacterium]|nr:MAG: hypothetical protein CM15mP111_1500 [Hyphomicrobiales bacterium]
METNRSGLTYRARLQMRALSDEYIKNYIRGIGIKFPKILGPMRLKVKGKFRLRVLEMTHSQFKDFNFNLQNF